MPSVSQRIENLNFHVSAPVDESERQICKEREHKPEDTIPLRIPNKLASKSLGAECRDVIDRIRSLTFCIHDEEELFNLRQNLTEIYSHLRAKAYKEDNLVVEELLV